MLVYLALVLSFHRSLTESALLRFNRPSRTCRADFSLFRSAAFRAGSPLISARRKSCRLVTRSSDNVRRKPGVPTYPHLDRFPVSRDLYRQQKGFGSRRSVRDRVARRGVTRARCTVSKVRRKAALLCLIRSARIISSAATWRGTIRPRRFYADGEIAFPKGERPRRNGGGGGVCKRTR